MDSKKLVRRGKKGTMKRVKREGGGTKDKIQEDRVISYDDMTLKPKIRKTRNGCPSLENISTESQIAKALINNLGIQSKAADELGMSPSALYQRIQHSSTLKLVLEEVKERRKDLAEYNIIKFLMEQDVLDPKLKKLQIDSSFKFLDRQAKDRDYGEKVKHELPEKPIQIQVIPACNIEIDAEEAVIIEEDDD